ncbi:hypothetical protein ACP70R_026986 [Stipagrostis hirtigluma subsp. patula]
MLPEPRAAASGPRDRLSGLPDGVLLAILSLLPARQAVQTTVLSRSWRRLWRCVPCITVDEGDFGVHPRTEAEAAELARFVDFATNLLSRRCTSLPLDMFRLYARRRPTTPVDGWIRRAVECCPTVLEVEIPLAYPVADDHAQAFVFPHLGSSLFRRLQRLRLGYIWNCCSLTPATNSARDSEQPTVITAPSLESIILRIGDDSDFRYGISVCNAASLIKASICVDYFSEENLHSLLGGLFNVTSLELEGFHTMGIMRDLSLKRCFLGHGYDTVESKFEDLGKFLVNSPCLEKLTLWHCMGQGDWKGISLRRQDG